MEIQTPAAGHGAYPPDAVVGFPEVDGAHGRQKGPQNCDWRAQQCGTGFSNIKKSISIFKLRKLVVINLKER